MSRKILISTLMGGILSFAPIAILASGISAHASSEDASLLVTRANQPVAPSQFSIYEESKQSAIIPMAGVTNSSDGISAASLSNAGVSWKVPQLALPNGSTLCTEAQKYTFLDMGAQVKVDKDQFWMGTLNSLTCSGAGAVPVQLALLGFMENGQSKFIFFKEQSQNPEPGDVLTVRLSLAPKKSSDNFVFEVTNLRNKVQLQWVAQYPPGTTIDTVLSGAMLFQDDIPALIAASSNHMINVLGSASWTLNNATFTCAMNNQACTDSSGLPVASASPTSVQYDGATFFIGKLTSLVSGTFSVVSPDIVGH